MEALLKETIANKIYATFTFGANNLYKTGVTIRVKMVELIKPPIRTQAKGEYNGLNSMASGIKPPIAVKVVKIMGTKRVSPAS